MGLRRRMRRPETGDFYSFLRNFVRGAIIFKKNFNTVNKFS